jgi:hypothetical protein
MNAEALLAAEFSRWAREGRRPRLFLRDDDAIADTAQLQRLLAICERFGMPLLLASIPRDADATLARAVRGNALVTAAIHGHAHVNHAPRGEKPCEMGDHRRLETVLGELRRGREKLLDLFDGRLSGLLVPPWNRISANVARHAVEAGFTAISTHGWNIPAGLPPMVNTHLDIIHWSGGRVGRQWEWVAEQLAINLAEARSRGHAAVGILAHHLAHDEQAWRMLEAIGETAARHGAVFVEADGLIGEAGAMPAGDQA